MSVRPSHKINKFTSKSKKFLVSSEVRALRFFQISVNNNFHKNFFRLELGLQNHAVFNLFFLSKNKKKLEKFLDPGVHPFSDIFEHERPDESCAVSFRRADRVCRLKQFSGKKFDFDTSQPW